MRQRDWHGRFMEGAATHGHAAGPSVTRVYRAWQEMRKRCLRPQNPQFFRYGGRGITICERWDLFDNFLADMGEPPPGLTLDRIDNNGNYEPTNCRWASRKMQATNRRNTVWVEVEGMRVSLTEAARLCGIKRTTLRQRVNKGWPRSEWFKPTDAPQVPQTMANNAKEMLE